ncbi:MAG: 3'(2'),5'-bisphosphate nucleotidase CysQ [Acidobacteria bacterium]|nr:3'(2'),5'-bisphosphate nucleotidase CysQ [Acidobacteriota bacterium]
MHRELQVALDLARRAGEEILHFDPLAHPVEEKEHDEGPVTAADRNADRIIRDGLIRAFPNDALLSEETPDDLARLTSERLWLVDPLDGTRQYVLGIKEFAVLIGLAVGGRAVLGVIHLPAEDLTWFAAMGEGAFRQRGDGKPVRVELDPLPADRERLVITLSRSHAGARTRRVAEALGAGHVISSGSVGRKAALVLAGEADVYVSLGNRSRHWDACAPDAVLHEAGGEFRTARGERLAYNTEFTQNRSGLMACRRGLLERVVSAVESVLDPREPGDA